MELASRFSVEFVGPFAILTVLVYSSQGYLPANTERRESTLQRKRQEYFGFIEQYYDSRNDEHHQDTYRQVRMLSMTTHIHILSLSQSLSFFLSLLLPHVFLYSYIH